MSDNIHGFSHSNNNINREYRQVPMEENENPKQSIREESFLHFLSSIFCPDLSFLSVVFILSIINLLIFIITLLFGVKRTPTELLAPTFETLDKFGMKYPAKIYKGQIHRLILYGLLHANLLHILMNVISQLMIGCTLEKKIGSLKIGLLYLISNICGGMFSCMCSNAPGVGASVAIFGIFSGLIGYYIMNWHYLDRVMNPRQKWCNLLFYAMIIIMNLSYGFTNNSVIDNYGHLGGLIFGFLTIFLITSPESEDDPVGCGFKIWRIITAILFASVLLTSILIFWLLKKPTL